ncbi:molybdopterin-guanine dinucleotide biosynthesis protein A [Pseudoroseomonas rhizosphaerae]|uniref:Molybdopterin-guanine dinucleotide biosynthesis protein A n=1 Tax=Teichococcus rhizosphaerae TaxID=1335062 RepID=A0A2C7A9U7_9PROT|nr:DUF3305 domain-containing protein [Pseudoroseomonas rhizosphaerae]PHK95160.1 molybdopterin-guanine dinucleotide biosynthesis protein A [Pseudoroseomonas rhizosphaerae]
MLTDTPDSLRIPVAVIAERRPANSPWADWSWRVVEVLAEAPALPPWTLLRQEAGRSLFLAGHAELALHPTDTSNYKHNLESGAPRLWVVLRPASGEPGMALHTVTADPGEAHLYADVGNDTLESLPLPDFLRAPLEEYVARHHRERGFTKRRRDRADPEALARRRPGRTGDDGPYGNGPDGDGPDGGGEGE